MKLFCKPSISSRAILICLISGTDPLEKLPTNNDANASPSNVSESQPDSLLQSQEAEHEKQDLKEEEEGINVNLRNSTAAQLLERIDDKLCGKDWVHKGHETLNVQDQVDVLIHEATSRYNLAQAYLGWSPFW